MIRSIGTGFANGEFRTLKNKAYKRAELVKVGLVIPKAESCTSQCHNTESPFVSKDTVFNYEESKKKGLHDHVALKYPH